MAHSGSAGDRLRCATTRKIDVTIRDIARSPVGQRWEEKMADPGLILPPNFYRLNGTQWHILEAPATG